MISGLWFVILNVSEGSENINVGVTDPFVTSFFRMTRNKVPLDNKGAENLLSVMSVLSVLKHSEHGFPDTFWF